MAYVISGFFAGLAAIAYSAVFSTVQPGTGAGFELEAIGGAIIGGVSASGGIGSVEGSLIGVLNKRHQHYQKQYPEETKRYLRAVHRNLKDIPEPASWRPARRP